jgi:adenylyltransferase/sulfurtransferase
MQEKERYIRQLSLPEVGERGQELLKASKVLIIGAGGLGSPVALYLAAAGVGTLGILDHDKVSTSNFNRQILYEENDEGKRKIDAAAEKIKRQNSHVHIEVYPEKITRENYRRALEIVAGYDIVVDACDNMATRYLVSDITEELSIPFVYGAMEGFCGYVSVFNDASSCRRFRHLWPEEGQELPPEIPSIGVTAGVIGCLQANEVIKRICGFGQRLAGKLLTVDLCNMEFHVISI